MPPYFEYELWNGKKVVGTVGSSHPFYGNYVLFPELAMFKQPYNQKPKQIKVPIIRRLISDDGINIHFRVCLDVRRKSKRQIKIISEGQKF